jgi:hypothetical protein
MESAGDVRLLPSYEIWAWVPHYEGRIEVSNRGRVRSWIKSEKKKIVFLSEPVSKAVFINNRGYVSVLIGNAKFKDNKTVRVHTWVAKLFVLNPNNLSDPNHLNGIKVDNGWWNFEWTTHYDNLNHAFKTGLVGLCLGENQSQTKLSNKDVLEIFNSSDSTKMLSSMYSISYHTVLDIKRGRTWAHLTGLKRHFKPSERGKYKKEYN